MKPLAIDLFSGLGGWTEGLLAEDFAVVGFDIERHVYGDHRYPAQLVLQDVTTLHGSQFRDAALIVASPPCQEFSYMAMPWTIAKEKAAAIRADETGAELARLTALFDACFRIQREACEASGRHIPMVVENVRGAQPWVGRARWNFGSFYLWGDMPALMPPILARKSAGLNWSDRSKPCDYTRHAGEQAIKNAGGSWFAIGSPGQKVTKQNPDGRKSVGPAWDAEKGCGAHGMKRWANPAEGTKNGNDWFGSGADCSLQRRAGSGSSQRKFASAMIAKIPLPLSRWIAATYRPEET